MSNEMNDMKQYNPPGFPATEAWKSMQEILDKEMPVEEERKRFAFFWFLLFLLLIGGAFLYTNNKSDANKIVLNSNPDKTAQTLTKKTNKISVNNELDNSQTNSLSDNISEEKNIKNKNSNFDNSSDLSKSNKHESANEGQSQNLYVSKTKTVLYNKVKSGKQFIGRRSFGDLRAMKIDKGETQPTIYEVSKKSDVAIINVTSESNIIVEASANKEEASVAEKASVNTLKNTVAKTPVKVPKNKLSNSLHYGLQWNLLLPQANSYLNYNAKNQPLSVVIPEFWVSKKIGKKGEIGLELNPYSQYTLHSNNILSSNDYSVSILQGSTTNPTTLRYVQTRSLLKAMGVEFTAKYTYHFNEHFGLALGIGNNWLNAAVVNDRIQGKNDKLVHDSSYGIAKGFNDWNYLKSSFLVGRVEVLYQFKKIQVGLAFVKPLGDIYSFPNTNRNPINSRLVLRWKIK